MMSRDEPKFTFRMPFEVKEQLKNRALVNGRSFNAELLQIVQDALESPDQTCGAHSDVERIAEQQAETVKQMVFETLKLMYGKGA